MALKALKYALFDEDKSANVPFINDTIEEPESTIITILKERQVMVRKSENQVSFASPLIQEFYWWFYLRAH